MTGHNIKSIDVETLDAYICGLLCKEEKQRVANLIETTPEYQTYINMQKKYIDAATQAGWLDENGELSVPEHVMKGNIKTIKDIPLRLISCVLETSEKITFKTIEGLGDVFQPAIPRFIEAMANKKEKDIQIKPQAVKNDDFHINAVQNRKDQLTINISTKKTDQTLNGIIIQIHDTGGNVLATSITDSSGKANIQMDVEKQ